MGANVGTPSSEDLFLLHEGSLYHSYRILGAHVSKRKGYEGVRFAVWAPNAKQVNVLGDFNQWQSGKHRMEKFSSLGVWMLFIPEASEGDHYKYEILSETGQILLKADPYAFYSEVRPGTASRVVDLDGYEWQDEAWLEQKKLAPAYNKPLSIYEVHLGTWRKKDRHSEELYTYDQLADELVDYAVEMGYTHIEVMPLAEHPFDRSWGYQATGYFSVTSRHGSPKEFMHFVDRCHQKGIGVIMDWVPGHFCKDAHGLRQFDGKPLYEYQDPRKAEKLEWGTLTFDFGRPEVQSFLISNAIFWMDMYHIDGIRVDAVASMLHLNFGRWNEKPLKNQWGGDDNPEAVAFLRKLNQVVFSYYPDALMMAEDSTDWPLVTAPVHDGGLGFNYKWNMGWMNDMLRYMKLDPVHRKYHHKLITFSFMYAFSENYVLPFSHDEVVHGKRSLLHKMPGDYWQKFANLRVLYGYMSGHPGKKLLFMGSEFGQFDEWKDQEEVDWFLLDGYEKHEQMHVYVKALNQFYLDQPALWQKDHSPDGFKWINPHDESQSVVTFMRKGNKAEDDLILICNFTPVVHPDYRIGVPRNGMYEVVFNSDAPEFGGSGQGNKLPITSEKRKYHELPYSLSLCIPPLAAVYIKCVKEFQLEKTKLKGEIRDAQ
ncbi:1,4-alpha-glucan branching protein GlgB [Paenibacillus sp. CGMCC 1.16610]|uniref:1,4-alpha-glucan branching enzyme GlgB n=1 Tax=Paenibacillus anseongense TaxID=2682845 RepID=A0ABW9UIV9_9BACL|nr:MULTISPECIES: 1,4-alpha-glucan branching protein GlgB [Paenibacillus]MBA2939946.1 1,4-alpha-glucan branching protein GlgB [Paenibacillus sp. CGMCC 1.16610]MVQ38901.1 1,4-alpha-glucan branching protein GlgB [Paenibacillus anseongense]